MQGDLISRSEAIALLEKNMSNDIQDRIITENNINLIRAVPTAYNVDKVVEQLEQEKSDLTTWAEDMAYKIGIEKAVDIVRNGGKE